MSKKIYLSADIEGTCGIAHWDETEKGHIGYDQFARQMSLEVAAACEGAQAGGAQEILVKDAHDSGRNILPDLLPEGIEIFRSWGRDPFSMMSEIDETYAGVIFTGYHSAASWDGNPLSHTMNTHNICVKINGIVTSEMLLNSYTAAMFGVPVFMATGDAMVCEFIKTLNPNIHTVPVSRGVGNGSVSIHPATAIRRIRETAKLAVEEGLKEPERFAIVLPSEFEVEVSFHQHYMARRASFYKGARQVDSRTVRYCCDNQMDVIRFLMFTL